MNRFTAYTAIAMSIACSGSTTDVTDSADSGTTEEMIDVELYVFDPENPNDPPCFEWTTVSKPAEHWSSYADSMAASSGCAFNDILLAFEADDGMCYLIPGDCVSDPTLTADGSGCASAPECKEGRPDF